MLQSMGSQRVGHDFVAKQQNIFIFLIVFNYLFLVVLGLHCYSRAFSSCTEQGFRSCWGMQASSCAGFTCCRVHALGQEGFSPWGWRFLQRGLRTCALWAKLLLTCGIFPDRDLTCVLCIGRWAHNHSSRGVQFLVFLEKFAVRFLTTHAIFRSVIIFSLYLKNLSFITDF